MKKQLHNFLMIGAISLGFVGSAMAYDTIQAVDGGHKLASQTMGTMANNNNDSYSAQELQSQVELKILQAKQSAERDALKQSISTRLHQVLEQKFNQKLVTQHAQLNVDIVPSDATLKINHDLSQKAGISNVGVEPVFGENTLERVGSMCQIKVAYDDKGNILPLVEGNPHDTEQLFKTIAFQNEQQKQMAQEFVLLHEFFHCEFGNVENPIRIAGKSAAFNQRINFALKDQFTNGQVGALSYTDTLNEAFADVGASSIMYMQYGQDISKREDFMYVMDAIKTQRYASYFEGQYDAHMTHFSLNHVFEPSTLAKLDQINAQSKASPDLIHAKELRDLAFDIANQGTLELIANNKNMREVMLSENNVLAGVIINATNFIHSENISPALRSEKDFPRSWSQNVSYGVSYQLGKQVAEQLKGKAYFDPDGVPTSSFNYLTRDLVNIVNNNMAETSKKELKQAVNDMQELQSYALSEYRVSAFDSIQKRQELSQDVVSQKIKTLREDFAKRTQNHANAPTMSLK